MGAYDNDHRVQPHPDGSWMVFSDDCRTEWAVRQARNGRWDTFDADGAAVLEASDMPSMDDAIRALIGPPKVSP